MPNIHSSISFALVHIPIQMNPIIRNNDTSFHQLHKKCFTRIKYEKVCPHCRISLKESDIIKGYELEKEDYILFDKQELNALKLENEKEIEILSFVLLKDIDPCYFEKSYFLSPEKKSKAYTLFCEALKKSKRVALAKTVIGSKFYYCILRPAMDGLILTTLYFDEEVVIPSQNKESKVTEKELKLALQLIDSLKGNFEPEKYKDEYQNRIQEAISSKVHGKTMKFKKANSKKQVHDLMTALEKSLKGNK